MAKTPTRRSSSTAVTTWKDDLAKEAEIARGMEKNVGASNFFSLKNGKLSYNDTPVPGNHMVVNILDYVLENAYYDQDYDPETPASPICFAFGRDEDTMAPHADSQDPQAETCKQCEWNKFGSAERGRGKACRNSRRLALTPAGKFDGDDVITMGEASDYENSDIAYLKVPPTSLKGWAQFVREVSGIYDGPPMVVYTIVSVVDHAQDQFHVQFQHHGPVTDEMGPVLKARRDSIRKSGELEQPYQPIDYEEEQPKPRARTSKKKVAKKKAGARKY